MISYHPENRNLFSDAYLELRFIKDSSNLESESREAFQKLFELRRQSKPERFGPGKEQQLREEYIDKVLDIIGWSRSGEGRIPSDGKPDYTLFLSGPEKDAALSQVGTLEFFRDSVTLCEAKPWGTSFHRVSSEGKSPRGQIYGYLEDTHVSWGFVTNGKEWMLVSREFSRAQQRDYTVDLDALLLESRWSPQFCYFYGLFSRRAFSEGIVQKALVESRVSGELVGQNLKSNVYDALLILGRSIFASKPSDFQSVDRLAELKADCLTFLYRLLFINFAESRRLLPMRDSDLYRRSYSFLRVKEEVQRLAPRMTLEEYERIPTEGVGLYRNVKKLFRAIDQGLPLAQIPAYNGGLFKSDDHPFLEAVEIDDRTIAQVVDLLSRSRSDPERFIDYSYLGVRELGSIYEGLLEYQFRVADQPLTAAFDVARRIELWVPAQQLVDRKHSHQSEEVRKGDLYLATGAGERKSTGSYYTPDEVVRYIIRGCLGPVVNRRLEEARSSSKDRQQALLQIKVLDPAMGSGHFLVAATEFLAERLLEISEEQSGESADVPDGELEAQAKRQVVSHCIYGVDSNPMAVELARVSLWLTTFSRGHPLTFLDHRLKCGNSLVGTTLLDMAWLPHERPPNVEVPITQPQSLVREQLRVLSEIESGLEDTVAEVRRKEEAYRRLGDSEAFKRFKALADVHTGLYFTRTDHSQIKAPYMEIANEVVYGDPEKWERKTHFAWVQEALREALAHQAFHWQLEFPDVLVNPARGPKGGFDAVVGNPPYVRAEIADKAERRYLMDVPSYSHLVGRFDLSLPFLERGLTLTLPVGRFGMIVTSPVLTTNYGESVRRWLLSDFRLESVVDFGDYDVFPGVAVKTCILVAEKSPPTPDHEVQVSAPKDVEALGSGQRPLPQALFLSNEGAAIRVGLNSSNLRIKEKVDALSIPVGQLCYCITGVVAHDPKTHESKNRLISDSPKNQWYRPYIEAKEWEGRYSWIAPSRFIEYRPDVPGHMHRPKFPELFSSPKIFIQGISGSQIIATLDRQGVIANHSLLCCVKAEDVLYLAGKRNLTERERELLEPDPRYDLRCVLGLLCSRLVSFYYSSFLQSSSGLPPDTVLLLPLLRIDFDSARDQSTADAVQLLTRMEGQPPNLVREFSSTPPALRTKVAHDYICQAVSMLIENNHAIQEERRGFLAWLRQEVGMDPLELAGRKELREYDGLSFDRLLNILKKNKGRLSSDLSSRDFQERLRAEFEKSLKLIRPKRESNQVKIEAIDALMFWLYGLTDAEVALVRQAS